ncbi:signal peptidase II [Mycoplasma hafezii]|uniref:signal peptidase II n=1 Tax=Mycoplasma hafezii TaxID=525886 RepID=UPI003CE9A640
MNIEKLKLNVSSFLEKSKKYLHKNKKQILINYIILIGVFTIFLVIDQLTKQYLWNHPVDVFGQHSETSAESIWPANKVYGGSEHGNGIIGIRNVWHKGVTVLPESWDVIAAVQALSIILAIVVLIIPIFLKSKYAIYYALGLGILLAGDLGNCIDRFRFLGYVKDIFYVPFWENWKGQTVGTFNYADLSIFIAIVILLVTTIVNVITEYIKDKKKKKNQINSELQN